MHVSGPITPAVLLLYHRRYHPSLFLSDHELGLAFPSMLRARLSSIANASTPVVSRGNIPACTFSTQNIYSGTYYLSRSFWPTRPQTTSNLGPCGKPLEHVRFFAAKSKHSKRSKKRKDEQPERVCIYLCHSFSSLFPFTQSRFIKEMDET